MSALLRHPDAVPALFSPGAAEADPARARRPRARQPRAAAAQVALPMLILVAELPLIRDAAMLLRLALPH